MKTIYLYSDLTDWTTVADAPVVPVCCRSKKTYILIITILIVFTAKINKFSYICATEQLRSIGGTPLNTTPLNIKH